MTEQSVVQLLNEQMIIQLFALLTLVVTTAGGCFTYWVTRRYSGQIAETARKVDIKQDAVIKQNDVIIKQNDVGLEQIGQVRDEINGRLSQLVNAAVAAALNKGRIQGATDERLRMEMEKSKEAVKPITEEPSSK